MLSNHSIHAWLNQNKIKTETGQHLDFRNHLFLFDIYRDFTPKQAIEKAAQVGLTTLQILKSFWVAKQRRMDIIYTLPTENDVQSFAGGKVNRLVSQNAILQEYVKDKDSVEQKRVGNNVIYYRGTWSQKAAIMVSSDLNIYDEVDSSKPDVVEQYSTRLQHSKHRWEWYFSHPSAEGSGVDKFWQKSDQKHWFIKCPRCSKRQYLDWPVSIDEESKTFICKFCKKVLSDEDRRVGEWIQKYRDREISGYWIPLLIAPWTSAKQIVEDYHNKSEEYFFNKVLGKPYIGGGNKLTKALLMQNLSEVKRQGRMIIGLDTGKRLHYVAGNQGGLVLYGECSDYGEIELMMKRWPDAICIVDQGGDLIGSRKLREKFVGRVYLCAYGQDRKGKQLVRWGKKDEYGSVIVDRNRMLQMVVDKFTDKQIPLYGTESDWHIYWLHWNNLTRITEENERGMLRKVWQRSGDDHWCHATAYWYTGITRFANKGGIFTGEKEEKSSPVLNEDQTIKAPDTKQWIYAERQPDWRKAH